MTSSKESKETLAEFVKKAINMLIDGQISETLVLSSYKINSILEDRFGKKFKVDRIGRALSRIAKQRNLKRMSTNVPKYKLKKSSFKKFAVSD